MKAKDFIEKFGWSEAKKVIENSPELATQYDHEFNDYGDSELDHVIKIESAVYISDLKQYTDAWWLVNKHKGLTMAHYDLDRMVRIKSFNYDYYQLKKSHPISRINRGEGCLEI